jgi:hypothetical protein
MPAPGPRDIRLLERAELHAFVAENVRTLLEDEAVAVLANRHCSGRQCDLIAQVPRLVAFYSVRLRLVAHRGTGRAHALKLIHYLRWPDLMRLSIDMTVLPPVRRGIDALMLLRAPELTKGERIASARSCSGALIHHFLRDPDERIFASLLVNPRLREDDLVAAAASDRITPEQLRVLASAPKWSQRTPVRRAVAMNPRSPRAVAAAQLPHLSARELEAIHGHPATTVYVRRCIERLALHASSAARPRPRAD